MGVNGNPMTAEKRGALFVFAAAALYSIGGLCMKVIPWNGMSINGGRTAIAAAVVGLYLMFTGHRLRWNRWIFLGALCICVTNNLFSVANKMTTAANAIVLQYTAPIFVILLSVFLLHKRPGRLDLLACAVVLGGIILCFAESLSGGGLAGDVLALLSGLTYAGVFMMNDMPDSDGLSSVFWGDLISAAVGLPFLTLETDFSFIPLLSLTVLGVFQVGLAFIFLTEGLKTTPAVTASLVSGIEPVLNPILVAIFYHETMGPLALAGAAVVILGVVGYNVLQARQTAKML